MQCLIIAAGRGSRLATRGDCKPLVSLLGLTLIERVILTAHQAGLRDFCVVNGYHGEKLRNFLDAFSRKRGIRISHLSNANWDDGNGLSVLRARELLRENFMLLMADHIFDPAILLRMQQEKVRAGEILLAVDYNVAGNRLVNRCDATKVRTAGGRIWDIGKQLTDFNAYDTGIFFCSPALFGALEESLGRGDSSLSGAIKVMAQRGQAVAFDVGGAFWIDVDDEESWQRARRLLLTSLQKTSDGPVARHLNRPISLQITKQLVKFKITPNMISFAAFMLAVVGAVFFFFSGHINLIIGALLAQSASVIDGCDGEVARLKFMKTESGAWFDAVLDRYADALLLLGLTYHIYAGNPGFPPLLVGFGAIIGSFMNSYTADKYDGLMAKIASGRPYFRLGRDARILLILAAALLNQPLALLTILALLMNGENLRRIWLVTRRDHSAHSGKGR